MNLKDKIRALILLPQNRTWVIDSWWIKASALEDVLEESEKCQELDPHQPTQMNLLDLLEKEESK